jgi:hypothetical protein
MRIDWEQREIRLLNKVIPFREARKIAIEYIPSFVQEYRVKSDGLRTTIDWRSVFYSSKFKKLLIFLHI